MTRNNMPLRDAVTGWAAWLRDNRQYWMLMVLGALVLTLGRACLMWWQAPTDWQADAAELRQAFWIGARFDLKNLAILLGIPVLLGMVACVLPTRIQRTWHGVLQGWLWLSMLLVNLLMVVNYYYFQFYQGPINSLVFGFAEDDTGAVLKTLWSDFPVVRVLLGVILLTVAQLKVSYWWARRRSASPVAGWKITVIVLGSLILTVGLARGSLGKFPLRTMHMAVSSDTFTNNLVPSGVLALQQAWKERQISDLGDDPAAGLRQYGFGSIDEVFQVLASQPGLAAGQNEDVAGGGAAAVRGISPDSLLWRNLPQQAALQQARKPHVVVAVMESWGRHMQTFDDPESNDVLGHLRPWINSGRLDYFGKALSYQHGTHPSLEGLLLDTPITPLTQSRYGYHAYSTAVALPYRQAGYRTVFLTAGSASWRRLDVALRQQGFDEVLGESAIRERFPEATANTWGLDDEWMFRYGRELLAQADAQGQPVMLVMLSVTNHPPYRIPEHYKAGRLDTGRLGAALATDADTGRSILETYQYSSDALGEFLDGLEGDGLLEHTLFAATGDHNTRTIFAYPDSRQLFYKYGVPIVMRIPEAYRLGGTAHTGEWVSHQDIFPTLWAHSLSGVRVPRIGRDIYADSTDPAAVSFISEDGQGGMGILISAQGAVTGFVRPTYYEWDATGQLKPTIQPSPELVLLWQRERAGLALRDWRIRSEALQ
ncbi:MAG: sulfatase-like hydrolase/transferase [Corticimicrobacter sp.]|uniref:LTA synthase family protein n=1 Tax=Corticimicrobacter sp. TaxID=2678536 RepID=UPI0032D9B7ED